MRDRLVGGDDGGDGVASHDRRGHGHALRRRRRPARRPAPGAPCGRRRGGPGDAGGGAGDDRAAARWSRHRRRIGRGRGEDRLRVVVTAAQVDDEDRFVDVVSRVGLLEIVDTYGRFLAPGTLVTTTLGGPPASEATPAGSPVPVGPVYETIVSGDDLKDVHPTINQLGQVIVGFELTDAAAARFYAFTGAHIGQPLTIVLDKRVVSTAMINSAIRNQGIIEEIPAAEVRDLVVILSSKALPVPVEVVSVETVPSAPGSPTAAAPVAA
jgi:preprotein translocase subunit SecD